jgi:hypothetical protein
VFAEVPPFRGPPQCCSKVPLNNRPWLPQSGCSINLLNTETINLVGTKMDGQKYSPSPVGFAQVVGAQDGFDAY